MMNTTINYTPEHATIMVSPSAPLTELAFALEFVSNNFVGRGVYRWSVERTRTESGSCMVNCSALCKSGPMLISQVAQLGGAVQQKVIPYNIKPDDSFLDKQPQEKVRVAGDGQNRFGLAKLFSELVEGWTESIIESADLNPHATMATYSYGFADMTVGLFALGVKELKYQITQKTSQLYIKHQLSDDRIIGYFQQEGNDYPIDMTVGKLSS